MHAPVGILHPPIPVSRDIKIPADSKDGGDPQRNYDLDYREEVIFWSDGARGPVAGCYVP
jgi:hypothetical protein